MKYVGRILIEREERLNLSTSVYFIFSLFGRNPSEENLYLKDKLNKYISVKIPVSASLQRSRFVFSAFIGLFFFIVPN